MNFAVVFSVMGVVALLAAVFFVTRFHRFSVCKRISKRSRALSWMVALLPVLLIGIYTYFEPVSMIVVILHLFVIWLLADLIGLIVKKCKKKTWTIYWQGIGAIIFTVCYLAVGWYLAHNVWETDYQVAVGQEQSDSKLRIAMIADSHLGATFDGEGFARHMEKIQETNPDMLVIVGDFVDDDSKKVDMVRACQALGEFRSKYGVFFVYGNHDKGYFNYRDFTTEELVAEFEKNDVTVLEDEIVPIGEGFELIGRQDKSNWARADIDYLMSQSNPDKYSIVLDHQPSDYDAESRTNANLVLSGHTHGGWLFPMQFVSGLIGPDDRIYGREVREDTTFIVTSGISDWALPFKTGTWSEFVIIDIE